MARGEEVYVLPEMPRPAGARATSVDAITVSQRLHAPLQVAAGNETIKQQPDTTACQPLVVPPEPIPFVTCWKIQKYSSQADRCRSAHAGAKILVDDGCRRRENRTSWEYTYVGPECPIKTLQRTLQVRVYNSYTSDSHGSCQCN